MFHTIIEVLFWCFAAIALHTYFLFPQIIKIIASLLRASSTHSLQQLPKVTVVISAFNEEKVILNRLQNLDSLDYPMEKLEVLIGSDGSNDNTNSILHESTQKFPWLTPILFTENQGKATVCNKLVDKSSGEILIFGDADHFYEPNAVKNIVQYFADPNTGGVAGIIDMRNSPDESAVGVEEQSYYAYDTPIKIAEGDCGCMIGAHGGFFAIRKELYEPIPVELGVTDDFFISILPLWKGYKVVAARDAVSHTYSAPSVKDEFRRKVRFSATSFATLKYFWKLLFDTRFILSYCFWSHRVSKWFFPVIMILALFTNIYLLSSDIVYSVTMIGQASIYILAFVGFVMSRFGYKFKLFTFPYYFVVSNAALLMGLVRYIKSGNVTKWQPSR